MVARLNDQVAQLLQEYADLISITGGEPFKARVYERAARSVAGHPDDLATLDPTELKKIPNVGTSLAGKIAEYVRDGHIEALDRLRGRVPAGVRQLMDIPTLGPKRAMQLHQELHVSSVDELADAIEAGRLAGLRGFGARTAESLTYGIQLLRQAAGRVLVNVAMDLAEEIVSELSSVTGCLRCTYAGSLRRMRDTIGDVDILAAAEDSAPLMAAFAALPSMGGVAGSGMERLDRVIARGETKTSIRTATGLQVDLRVVPPAAWGAALLYFTGSQAHNIRIREIAVRKKLKLSEYGLFDSQTDELIVSETEEEVYQRLGLPWIPPPMREDRGEVEAAQRGELPTLVTEGDLRGDLHTHTNLTDGVAPLEEMLAAAQRRGYQYYAVTDHAPNLFMQRMSKEKMLAQREQVRQYSGTMTVLHGTELNIGPDGEVDWPAEFLAGFDLCVASVHSHFNQSRDQMTRRFVRACENPYVHIIGHPTTRMIGRRPGVDADLDEVFRAAARTGTALEVNAFPDRLDLSDEHIARARRYGVTFAIDSDSHAIGHLAVMRYGVGTAQRGWLTPEDVLNTWPLPQLRAFLRTGRRT